MAQPSLSILQVMLLMGLGGTHGLWRFQFEYLQQFCQAFQLWGWLLRRDMRSIKLPNNPHRWMQVFDGFMSMWMFQNEVKKTLKTNLPKKKKRCVFLISIQEDFWGTSKSNRNLKASKLEGDVATFDTKTLPLFRRFVLWITAARDILDTLMERYVGPPSVWHKTPWQFWMTWNGKRCTSLVSAWVAWLHRRCGLVDVGMGIKVWLVVGFLGCLFLRSAQNSNKANNSPTNGEVVD